MEAILTNSIAQVWLSLQHNWPYLLLSVAIATLLKLYINAEKVSALLQHHRGAGVITATIAAVATPLCSCGTTAVILGMMASTIPWAPIVAFMVSSPLTSPEGLVYSAGLFGWPFALAFYLASILLGLFGGWAAAWLESRGWLANQNRLAAARPAACACPANEGQPLAGQRSFSLDLPIMQFSSAEASCGCGSTALATASAAPAAAFPAAALHSSESPACGCSSGAAAGSLPLAANPGQAQKPRVTPLVFLKEMYNAGKNLLVMFLGFAFIGYFLNGLIPDSWVTALFGGGQLYSVPLAATLALPFYINSEASLPLVRALMEGGMSQGAALAFLIAGSGTSIGAITGALAIARWRIVALVVGVLWIGAILCGYAFDLALALNLF